MPPPVNAAERDGHRRCVKSMDPDCEDSASVWKGQHLSPLVQVMFKEGAIQECRKVICQCVNQVRASSCGQATSSCCIWRCDLCRLYEGEFQPGADMVARLSAAMQAAKKQQVN